MYHLPKEMHVVYYDYDSYPEVDKLRKIHNELNFIYYLTGPMFVHNTISKIKNPWSLIKIYKISNRNIIIEDLSKNPNTPVNFLYKMYEKDPFHANLGLALNPNTPLSLLEKIFLNPTSHNYAKRIVTERIYDLICA